MPAACCTLRQAGWEALPCGTAARVACKSGAVGPTAYLDAVQLAPVLLHLLFTHARQLGHLNVERAPAQQGNG